MMEDRRGVRGFRTDGGSQDQGEASMKSLFVGNMNFQTSESDLRALFEPFGQVTRVHMAMDRETGRARGFAFVEMPNDEEAAKAIAGLDGKEAGGRNLKVNEARPRGESGPPRSPRGFSGGNNSGSGGGGGKGKGGGGGRNRFSNEDYSEAVRQPREPRW
jgi:RNA recognition motif-containing protein